MRACYERSVITPLNLDLTFDVSEWGLWAIFAVVVKSSEICIIFVPQHNVAFDYPFCPGPWWPLHLDSSPKPLVSHVPARVHTLECKWEGAICGEFNDDGLGNFLAA